MSIVVNSIAETRKDVIMKRTKAPQARSVCLDRRLRIPAAEVALFILPVSRKRNVPITPLTKVGEAYAALV